MPSFDVISKINYQEFDNALANCLREIANRYDFKGLNISIERKDKIITTLAPDELKLKQVNELFETVRKKLRSRRRRVRRRKKFRHMQGKGNSPALDNPLAQPFR
jgi:uncharacterized protein YajQ (UPF0234 family)